MTTPIAEMTLNELLDAAASDKFSTTTVYARAEILDRFDSLRATMQVLKQALEREKELRGAAELDRNRYISDAVRFNALRRRWTETNTGLQRKLADEMDVIARDAPRVFTDDEFNALFDKLVVAVTSVLGAE